MAGGSKNRNSTTTDRLDPSVPVTLTLTVSARAANVVVDTVHVTRMDVSVSCWLEDARETSLLEALAAATFLALLMMAINDQPLQGIICGTTDVT